MLTDSFKIFVVEDDEWYNRMLVHHLSMNPDYEIHSFITAKDCLEHLNLKPDVITLDYRLPDQLGIDVLKQIKEINDDVRVILISGQDDIEVVVDILKHGAYDYIVKSTDIRDRLLNTINNLRQEVKLKKEIVSLQKEIKKKYKFQTAIIGNSPAINKVFELIEKAIRTNITVSISGETGTGKELVAKAIHYNSEQAKKPFITVNMAAIPRELIESELFGHEKGSYTGASARRIGKFEEANEGTLFLDEIAELDITLQSKLLRALQEREITRIGSNTPIKTNCRIIIATNRNLSEETEKGNFRQDLFFRLYGLPIELPPLRSRENDVILLANRFIQDFCSENKIPLKSLSSEAIEQLMSYHFPGNIRELKSVMELAVTLSDNEKIEPDNLIFSKKEEQFSPMISEDLTLRDYELLILKSYLKKYNNDIRLIAQKLNIGVATIYRMMKEQPK